jgi:hypothetical protein
VRMISCCNVSQNYSTKIEAHSVVAFMVNVRLVENNVKRRVGIVMVVKVTIQSRVFGRIRKKKSVILPNIPIQVVVSFTLCSAAAVARAAIEAMVEFIPAFSKLEEL